MNFAKIPAVGKVVPIKTHSCRFFFFFFLKLCWKVGSTVRVRKTGTFWRLFSEFSLQKLRKLNTRLRNFYFVKETATEGRKDQKSLCSSVLSENHRICNRVRDTCQQVRWYLLFLRNDHTFYSVKCSCPVKVC